MKFSRAALISPGDLADSLGLSTATLADWRSQRRGPTYLVVGRKICYPKERVDLWLQANLRETGDDDGRNRSVQGLAVQRAPGSGHYSSPRPPCLIHLLQVFDQAAEEREYFLRAAKNQNLYDLAQLMRNQGMRPEEVLSLRKQDVDLERGQPRIRSGKSKAAQRTLDLTSESLAILSRRWQDLSVWVFPSGRTSGSHLGRMNSAHDRVCRETKSQRALHFVLYDFRHTFATRMAQAGIDLATLTAILGHNSLRIVQRYVHPTVEHKQSAMRRFEESLTAIDQKVTGSAGRAIQ